MLLRFLDVVGVRSSDHEMELQVSPSCGEDTLQAFANRIERDREGITVLRHRGRRTHDRFYLFKSRKEVKGKRLSGVFGPSMNRIDGGLYVAGDLDDGPLKVITEALNL